MENLGFNYIQDLPPQTPPYKGGASSLNSIDQTQSSSNNSIQSSIVLENQTVPFLLRFNKRIRRMRLLVCPDDGLLVEAPGNLNLKRALNLIEKQKLWVLKHLKKTDKKQSAIKELKKEKNSVLIWGDEKKIEVRTAQTKDFIMETASRLIVGFSLSEVQAEAIRTTLKDWLLRKARFYFGLRVCQLAKGQFDFNRIIIKNQKTLWGSCSADKNLNFNWRLIMAPQFVSDYIIQHELCHTRHLNHSKKFWCAVQHFNPDYQKAEAWLKKYSLALKID